MVECDEWVGGVRQCYGRVCGRPFLARDTCVTVAPMAARAGGEEEMSAGWISSTTRTSHRRQRCI